MIDAIRNENYVESRRLLVIPPYHLCDHSDITTSVVISKLAYQVTREGDWCRLTEILDIVEKLFPSFASVRSSQLVPVLPM